VTAKRPSARDVQRSPQSTDVCRPEHHSISGGDIDEIEVHSSAGDLASEVREHSGTVLDVDHDHLALAGDSDVGDPQRMPRGLGVRDEDVEPGPTQVAAAMLTPASLIAVATRASAPGVFSMSMTKSTAI
jgi:hypothetical protein